MRRLHAPWRSVRAPQTPAGGRGPPARPKAQGADVAASARIRYADNIVKCFATAIAIIAGTLLSVPIFGFAPSQLFLVGAPLTVAATVLYSAAPKQLLPCFNLVPKPEVAA